MPLKYKYVLFDADNTLFDFDIASRKSFLDNLKNIGITPSGELYDKYKVYNSFVWKELEFGNISTKELCFLRFKLFFDEERIDFDPLQFNSLYLNGIIQNCSLYRNTIQTLEILSNSNVQMSIITNGLKEVQRLRIRKAKIGHFFNHIVVSDEIGVTKPSSAYFQYIFDLLKRPNKQDVLVVGDSLNSDIKGGNNFGFDTCYKSDNINTVSDPNISPNFCIQNISEVIPIVREL